MTNARKILIVDDDTELRDALVEQLALHEEFDAEAVDSGSKGVQAARNCVSTKRARTRCSRSGRIRSGRVRSC